MKAVLSIILAATSLAQAQSNPGWKIEVLGGQVSPSNPSVVLVISAYFFSFFPSTAFGSGNFNIESTDSQGMFDNFQFGPGLANTCHGGNLGSASPLGGVLGVGIGQLNVLGCQASPENPIAIWTAEWFTTDFSPRSVELNTAGTTHFELYSHHGAPFPDIFFEPKDVIPGSGVIQVIPAPGGAILLVATLGLAVRRRR